MATREARADRAALGVLVALAALALGPVLLTRGVVLFGDMTFVPRQPWKSAWLGLDGSVPRAVPADAVVSVLTQVLAGDLVQKAILFAVLLLAGLGMTRLVVTMAPEVGRIAGLAGATLYLWNPYVHERLAIGHWGLLLGYAALPWVAAAAAGLRAGRPGSWARLACWLGVAAIGSPTGGLLAAVVALALCLGRRPAPALVASATALAVNLPWLVPGVLASGIGTDPAGVRAFAASSDTPLGVIGSLATFGGIWKQSVVASERDAWLLVLLSLAATIAGLAALIARARLRDEHRHARRPGPTPDVARRLLVLAALGFALALLPATGSGASLVEHLVDQVPGAGLLRDSQKWVALFALPACFGLAVAVDQLVRRAVRRGFSGRFVGVALVLAPLVLLPSMAWGLAGRLEPVRIPTDWEAASRVLADQSPDQRRTLVLPFSTYQRFSWNDDRAALDPAIRYFPGQVVTNDRLVLSGTVAVGGDSPASARIATALATGRPLGPVLNEEGIRFVLLERTAAGAEEELVPDGRVLHDGPEILLVDVGGLARIEESEHPWLIVAADLAALAVLLGAGTFLAVRRYVRKPGVIG